MRTRLVWKRDQRKGWTGGGGHSGLTTVGLVMGGVGGARCTVSGVGVYDWGVRKGQRMYWSVISMEVYTVGPGRFEC